MQATIFVTTVSNIVYS